MERGGERKRQRDREREEDGEREGKKYTQRTGDEEERDGHEDIWIKCKSRPLCTPPELL